MKNKVVMIPVLHSEQRYDVCGDYQDAHGITLFTISMMENEKHESLVFVHELIEKILVDARGITNADIDAFDIAFEQHRVEGNEEEPGHDPQAPYHKEHLFAEKVERMLAEELGVDWETYDKQVMGLSQ